jgi:large repetitive protein
MAIWYKNYSGCGYHHSCVGWGFWGAYNAYQPNCYKPNSAPVANHDAFTSNQGAVLTLSAGSLLSNDTDKNGDKLIITSVQASQNGSVALVNGNVIFTPAPHYTGPASFTYTISDGKGGSSTATVNITLKSVNTAPDAVNDNITITSQHVTYESNKITINPATLLANDKDANGDSLTINSVQCATNGTVALVNGQVVFTPNAGFSGTATFSYTVSDGKGGCDTAVVCLTIPNANPDAVNDAMNGNEDTPFVFLASTLLDNDTDANADALSVVSVQDAVNGTVKMVNGEVTFTPNANFYGIASFTYTISDGKGGTDTATVNLNICPVNDAPDAKDDGVFEVIQNSTITIAPATLAANDVDVDGDAFYGVSLQDAKHGVVEYINNQVVFTPEAGYIGEASFSYTIADGKGGFDTATVKLNVIAAPNAAPVALDDQVEGVQNQNVLISFDALLANDRDADGNLLRITSVQNAQNGTVSIQNGQVVFVPNNNYFGPAFFTYTISDGKGGFSTANVNLSIKASESPLVVVSTAASISEEGLLGGVADANGPQDNSNSNTASGRIQILDSTGTAEVVLRQPLDTITSNGQAVQWTGTGTQLLVGSIRNIPVIAVQIDNQGRYSVEMLRPLDHPIENVEDVLQIKVGVEVRAGQQTSTGVLTLNVEDDAPASQADSASVSLINTNMMIVLDTSGSMNSPAASGSNRSKFDLAKEAIEALIDKFDAAGMVSVRLITFNTGSEVVGDKWFNKTEAFAAIESLKLGGATNYDAPLSNAINAFDSPGKLTNAQNLSYFISDDDPNIGNGDELSLDGDSNVGLPDAGIQAAEESQWKAFLDSNQVKSYAIGIGQTVTTTEQLNPIAYDGQAQQDLSAVLVRDVTQLEPLLLETTPTIDNRPFGNLIGADNGFIQALLVGGVKYTFNEAAQLIAVSGTDASSYDAQTGIYTIQLASGNRFDFNLSTGTYDFKAPDGVPVTTFVERFDYILVDKDGDTSQSSITVNLSQSLVLVNDAQGGNLSGNAGLDTLYGSATQDIIFGSAGGDKIYAGAGDDTIQGGSGNDILTGGSGADTFVWTLADKDINAGLEKDMIRDFNPSADKLDLSDLLVGENTNNGIGNLLDYLSIEKSGTDTIVHVSDNGGFAAGYNQANETLQITLNNVDLLQLYSDNQTLLQNILKQSSTLP